MSLWSTHVIDGDEYYRPLASFLAVVNPSDYWYEIVHCHLVSEAVLAVEPDCLLIVFKE